MSGWPNKFKLAHEFLWAHNHDDDDDVHHHHHQTMEG
jgi:hypothetical protein